MQIEYAKNPRYASADESAVNLSVKFEEFTDEMPFTATAHDVEDYGRDLYARAVAGEFGIVAPYVAKAPA